MISPDNACLTYQQTGGILWSNAIASFSDLSIVKKKIYKISLAIMVKSTVYRNNPIRKKWFFGISLFMDFGWYST